MKPVRAAPMLLSSIVLVLASLACAQSSSPAATEPAAPPAATSEAAQPEPTQIPEPEFEVLFEETFADNENNWYVGEYEDAAASIDGGKYNVTIITQDYYAWFESPVSLSEVDVTFDTEFRGGAPENASYGLLCHYKDNDNFYRFSIAPDGYFNVYKRVGGEDTTLVEWKTTGALELGTGVVNKMRVICSDDHLILYANDTLLADVVDTSHTGGSFALTAGFGLAKEEDKTPIEVSFSNLTVLKPASD